MRTWTIYTYHEGRVNRYGYPIPDQFDTLTGAMRRSFSMMGNTSAKGAKRVSKDEARIVAIIDRLKGA